MLLLEGNMDGVGLLILGTFLYGLINIILLISGLVKLRKKPEDAKRLLFLAGLMFLIGAGSCGIMVN